MTITSQHQSAPRTANAPPIIRDYADADEQSWLRCRVLSFLASSYYDDVKTTRTVFDGEAIRLVAVTDKPQADSTPGPDLVIGVLDVELWDDDAEGRVATIDTIAVHPDHQRRGIADALLTEALRRMQALRPAPVLMDAWTREDQPANSWYRATGFTIDTEYLHVYARHGETGEQFTTPDRLSTPLSVFCHGKLADEQHWRDRFARVHRCRRYVRPLDTRPWPDVPELAAVYDAECAGRADHDFYLGLADRLAARRVTDIGCGTGVLAVALARRGHRVTGLDPARAVLDIAAARPGGDSVDWIAGTAEALPDAATDLIVMEGHVAQYFVTDEQWAQVLEHAHRALAPGGHLAFETRHPDRRAWQRWTPDATRAEYPHPSGGTFTSWTEIVGAPTGASASTVVTHRGHTVLPDGRHLRADETLIFRDRHAIEASLAAAGFVVAQTWGDFDGAPLTDDSAEIVLLARRA